MFDRRGVIQPLEQRFQLEGRLRQLFGKALAPDSHLAEGHLRFVDLATSGIHGLFQLQAALVEFAQFAVHLLDEPAR